MAATGVNPTAAKWIAHVLRDGQGEAVLETRLAQHGLSCLTIKEIKIVWTKMGELRVSYRPCLRPPKQSMVDTMARFLVEGQNINGVSVFEAMKDHLKSQNSARKTGTTGMQERVSSAVTPTPHSRLPASLQSGSTYMALPYPGMEVYAGAQKGSQKSASPQRPLKRSAPGTSSPSLHPNSNKKSKDTPVKFEVDDEGSSITSVSSEDAQTIESVYQMGIKSRTEILEAIRKLRTKNATGTLTPDQVLCRVVDTRAELEEAKQMDQARLESEQMRKDEARRRRESIALQDQERLESATIASWKCKDFPSSWILASSAFVLLEVMAAKDRAVKDALLKLLKLEKLARKWYGATLPLEYFSILLSERLAQQPNVGEMLHQLRDELRKLETAMYTLSEQSGGVPRLFLSTHDRLRNDNEDEVVVVRRVENETLLVESKSDDGVKSVVDLL